LIGEVLSDRVAVVDALCAGIAGVDRPDDSETIHGILERIGRSRWNLVTSDAVVALVAGAGERYGVVLLVGTGSAAYGIDRKGNVARAGGWGYLLADEGSGYWIGLNALRAVFRAADGRAGKTLLTPRILDSFGVKDVASLIKCVYGHDSREEIAALAQAVQEQAVLGDEAAQEILHEAGREIVRAADAVIEKLGIAGERFHLVLSGGLWKAVPGLKHEVSRLVSKIAPRAHVEQLLVDPVQGAVTLALESLA
jgi:N-acetylglucosamine kinase-like BadF-type ATPase